MIGCTVVDLQRTTDGGAAGIQCDDQPYLDESVRSVRAYSCSHSPPGFSRSHEGSGGKRLHVHPAGWVHQPVARWWTVAVGVAEISARFQCKEIRKPLLISQIEHQERAVRRDPDL